MKSQSGYLENMLLFLILLFSIVLAGGFTLQKQELPATASCLAKAPTSVAGIQQSLKKYGFLLFGTDGFATTGSLSEKNNALHKATSIFYTICNLAKSQKYLSLLGVGEKPVGIYLPDQKSPPTCVDDSERNPGDPTCLKSGRSDIYCVDVSGGCNDDYVNRYALGHEIGHIVENRNPQLYALFLQTVWDPKNRPPLWACIYHVYYPHDPTGAVTFPAECFADLQGEYTTYTKFRDFDFSPKGIYDGYQLTNTFSEYKTRWSTYYNFMRDKVFGGVEFIYTQPPGFK